MELAIPLQLLVAPIYIFVESFLASVITKIVCDWWELRDFQPWMRQDDVLVLVTLMVILVGIWWMREKTRLNWLLIGIVSLLVALIVCLNMWHFR